MFEKVYNKYNATDKGQYQKLANVYQQKIGKSANKQIWTCGEVTISKTAWDGTKSRQMLKKAY